VTLYSAFDPDYGICVGGTRYASSRMITINGKMNLMTKLKKFLTTGSAAAAF